MTQQILRRPLKELLLSMPPVGEDVDFERLPDRGRDLELRATSVACDLIPYPLLLGACAPENAGARFSLLARGRAFLEIVVGVELRHRAIGGEQNPGELASGRHCSLQVHSNRGLIWRKFSARQTNVHSPDTFFSPLKLNCRKPSTDLTQPFTGSTMLLRLE